MPCCKCKKYRWGDIQPAVFQAPRGKQREYCVFHAPSKHKGVSDSAFDIAVNDRVKLLDAPDDTKSIEGYHRCNLAGTIFPHQTTFVLPKHKTLILEFAKFRGNASFEHEIFGTSVYFNHATFYGNAWFQGARFKSSAVFYRTNFKQQADFENVTFSMIAAFEECNFYSETSFLHAIFSSSTSFISSNFSNKKTSFSNVQFLNKVDFQNTALHNDIDFSNAKFFNEAVFVNIESREYSITLTHVKPKYIANIISDNGTFNIFRFHRTELEGRILPNDAEDSFLKNKEQVFRLAKKDAASEHDQSNYSHWHYLEKTMKLAVLKRHHPWSWWLHWLGIYCWSSGYGEKWKNAASTLLLMLTFCLFLLGMGGVQSVVRTNETLSIIHTIQGPALPTCENIKNFGSVCLSLLKYLLLIKEESITFKPIYGLAEFFILLFTRLVIPIQAAFFAIALRNAYRR